MALIADDMICGFCQTAWDIVYGRCRSNTSPGTWVGYCARGGCDPDIWDYVEVDGTVGYQTPPFVERLYHRRNHRNPHGWDFKAPRQRVSYTPEEMLEREVNQRIAQKQKADEIEWDTDEEEIEWE